MASELSQSNSSNKQSTLSRLLQSSLIRFMLALFILFFLGIFFTVIKGNSDFENTRMRIAAQVKVHRNATKQPRAGLFVNLKNTQNAVLNYRAIAWVLQFPDSWAQSVPKFQSSPITKQFRNGNGPDFRDLNQQLDRMFDRFLNKSQTAESHKWDPVSDQQNLVSHELGELEENTCKTYAPLITHVEQGLSSTHCYWNAAFGQVVGAEDLPHDATQFVANLMMHDARNIGGRHGLMRGLQIIEFARDIARDHSLHVLSNALKIEQKGWNCLALELTRKQSAEDLDYLLNQLQKLPEFSPTNAYQAEHLQRLSFFTNIVKTVKTKAKAVNADSNSTKMLLYKLWLNHEIAELERLSQAAIEITEAPIHKRTALEAELSKEKLDSWARYVKIMIPFYSLVHDSVERNRCLQRMVFILAAANRYQIKHKTYPLILDEIRGDEELFGKIDPKHFSDPTSPGEKKLLIGVSKLGFWVKNNPDRLAYGLPNR